MLSRGGNFGGLSLRFSPFCWDFNINWSRTAATATRSACDPPNPELPELLALVPASLYGSSSGIGIFGRFLMSTAR